MYIGASSSELGRYISRLKALSDGSSPDLPKWFMGHGQCAVPNYNSYSLKRFFPEIKLVFRFRTAKLAISMWQVRLTTFTYEC